MTHAQFLRGHIGKKGKLVRNEASYLFLSGDGEEEISEVYGGFLIVSRGSLYRMAIPLSIFCLKY